MVKPSHRENGDFAQADKFGQIRLDSAGSVVANNWSLLVVGEVRVGRRASSVAGYRPETEREELHLHQQILLMQLNKLLL